MDCVEVCRRQRLFAALCVSFALVAGIPISDARACTPVLCNPAQLNLAGDTVPASIPALEFYTGHYRVLPQAELPELIAADGSRVAFSAEPGRSDGWLWLVPDAPLEPDETYTLRFETPCRKEELALAPATVERIFHTGSVLPEPQQIGEVVDVRYEVRPIEIPASGTCTREILGTVAMLELEVAPELQPFLPVSRVIARSGDQDAATHYSQESTERLTFELRSHCEARDPYADNILLSRGPHTIEISAEVAGIRQPLPAITANIVLECPDWTPRAKAEETPGSFGDCAVLPQRRTKASLLSLTPYLLAIALWRKRRSRRR